MGLQHRSVLYFGLVVLAGIALYSLADLVLRATTVAGDNLSPTPWHRYRQKKAWSRIRRIPTALRCRYSHQGQCDDAFPAAAGDSDRSGIGDTTSSSRSDSDQAAAAGVCPDYFKWIFQDLAPWRTRGITRGSLEQAKDAGGAFRVVIRQGKLYTELYYNCVYSRMMFTLWGLLKLLERYPGQVPDVDLLFNCQDRPVISKQEHDAHHSGESPPVLFGYCSTDDHFDIPFPDWSFWGWPEYHIAPWEEEFSNIFTSSQQLKWHERDPHAFWKGTPRPHIDVTIRDQLLRCNSSTGSHMYVQNWDKDLKRAESNLSNQCDHRYKLYVEGYAWSSSYKYIMACGSTVMAVDSDYYEFFSRGLLPHVHYLPVNRDSETMCQSLAGAIDWADQHPAAAEGIGLAGQEFMKTELRMDRVYDYMLHLLQEYARLQDFEPEVPQGAQLVCPKSVLCVAYQFQKEMLERSMLQQPHATSCIAIDPT